MELLKHTRGPWHIEVTHVTEGAYTISHGVNKHHDGPAGTVGKVYCSEADTTLMTAAPDLLEALKDARWRIANLVGPNGAQGLDRAALDKIDAAIAKAEAA